ncbi:MAG: asparagine synthase (glutamine-hydrolyzing) [Deltaproteobacteria bacterium]|jgi:asparagine synthase (glutamine-hydrolysing)|nr:asparagine synthase (glutamine-hydrolyzing) [Deltaproteobacteria bacterium]
MSGIAGFLNLDGSPLPPEASLWLKAMNDAHLHRGPDAEDAWLEGPVALGRRSLSVIDPASDGQPVCDATGRVHLCFDGRIYNYRELREDLVRRGHVFRTQSDAEVIVCAWLAHGIDFLDHLEGMFAFALWDARDKTLICARDRFGKKPLYYTVQQGRFFFASEITALKQAPGLNLTAARSSLAQYLAYGYVPTPQSIYKEVFKLTPAHFLQVRNGVPQLGEYWRMPLSQPAARSEDDLADELRHLLEQAVRRRLVGDAPLGVFLSGGIDSSIVAGLTASMRPQVSSFSIGFTEAGYDETSYARLVSAHFGTRHEERILSAEDCAGLLPSIAARMDEPMADASIVPTFLLAGFAREKVVVALGGDGADELFAGYEHFLGCRAADWYRGIPLAVRNLVDPLARFLPQSDSYINPRLAVQTFLAGTRVPPWLTVQSWLTAIGPDLQQTLWRRPDPSLLNNEAIFASTRDIHEQCPDPDPLVRLFLLYARQSLPDDDLFKVDRGAMMHSLEARAPFLDRDLADFASRLPVSYKLRFFTRKYLLKKACARLLPPEILKRNKRGFVIPVAGWLRGALKPLLLELLGPDFLKEQGLFNPKGAGALVEEHLSGRRDHRVALWTLLTLQLWWRRNRPSVE